MSYNSVRVPYQAHVAAVAAGTENAEIDAICTALADTLRDALAELPIPPLKAVYGSPPITVGAVPFLAVVEGNTEISEEGSTMRLHTHTLDVVLICGPATADPAQMRAIGRPYLYALDLVLSHNKSLDGRVSNLWVRRALWATLPYAGAAWYGRAFTVEIDTHYTWQPEWLS